MRRLLKYLKPYTLLIILAIVLLFVQANADLALPDYLSRIVNNQINHCRDLVLLLTCRTRGCLLVSSR